MTALKAPLSRRDFTKAAGLGGMIAAGSTSVLAATPALRTFPQGFRWGSATAAYQIEGAVNEDGRGLSIWDVFSRTPGKTKNGDTGDVACDSYHRFAEDTRLLKNLGAQTYRLSFAWPRIFPTGRGKVNRKGLDHYHRVIDNLLENGIEPFVTLYHWDLPAALPGGWQSRDTAKAFGDYAAVVAREFSDKVGNFFTLNEMRAFIGGGYAAGIQAPGLKLTGKQLNQTRHHAVLAHGIGVQAIRANARRAVRIGVAENVSIGVPAIEDEAHIRAARKMFRGENASYLVPILDGAYPAEWLAAQGANAPIVADGDMGLIGEPLDFVGVNIYTGAYVQLSASPRGYEVAEGGKLYPHMGLSWLKVLPEATYWGIRQISDIWQTKSIYITENGTVAADEMKDGSVRDVERIMYLRNYLGHIQRAAAEGYPISGYFLWSLLDNFEWSEGYSARFGLHYVDFATQQRTPKLSAAWYKEVIARNAVV
jgi:beta-glucosidase